MYGDEVYTDGRLDNDKRRRGADEFFAELDDGESLIFYYANHSNPFTDENDPKYVIIGVSRVKQVGKPLFYPNATDDIKKRFAQGMVRSEEHTSELQSLMRISYAVFCLKKKKNTQALTPISRHYTDK